MIAIPLIILFLLGAPQPTGPSTDPAAQPSPQQAKAQYEAYRQAAIHINELAGNIHSEADARAFVDAVAERMGGDELPWWATASIRHRVAHAEYGAVSDSSKLIPEQRIVNVWNEYVRELDAPEKTLVTVAEVHNLRDAQYTMNQRMWKKEQFPQSLWIMPDVYAVGSDGKVANGCRAIEALRTLHDMFSSFPSVQGARERVQKGILVSDLVKQREKDAVSRPQTVRSHLASASADTMPVRAAEIRYVQAHGEVDYVRLLEGLYEELFPAE
ncbi:MAG: hypothetical protein WCF74_09530 [Candidatus Sulfotelmatobacter sp.]